MASQSGYQQDPPKSHHRGGLREQLQSLEQRLEQRLDRLEAMLSLLAQAQLKGH